MLALLLLQISGVLYPIVHGSLAPATQSGVSRVFTPMLMTDGRSTAEATGIKEMEIDVLTDGDASADASEFQNTLNLYHPGFSQELQAGGASTQGDLMRVQYHPTLTLFEFLLTEREEVATEAREKGPLDAQVAAKVTALRQLQRELEDVVSNGLMSEKRQQWLVDKAALQERKGECTQRWTDLQAKQAESQEAWQQLADKARERNTPMETSAIVASEDLAVQDLFSKTSIKAQYELIRAQVALSQQQMLLDSREEALMADALQLYQEERPARKRREEIIEQQQKILTELQGLVQDKSAFVGLSAFVADGFAEGITY